MPACKYKYRSDDRRIDFSCKEETNRREDDLCIFHDKDHYSDNKYQVIEKLETKVSESISKEEPLECYGYLLPRISFSNLVTNRSFSQQVFFNEATFYEEADFSGIKFFNTVDFSKATFSKAANFYEFSNKSKGIEYTSPDQTKFFGAAVSFMEANFLETSVFNDAKFESGVNFSAARFHSKANFFETHFYQLAIFYGTRFLQDEVNFQQSKFLEGEAADFRATEFDSLARFTNVHFSEGVDFTSSKFSNEVRFSDKTQFDKETKFRDMLFEKPERVFIDVEDFSLCSFLNTDITKIRFRGTVKWGLEDRFTVFDDKEFELSLREHNGFPKIPLDSVLSVYRNLRENYEYRRRYDEAGQFFIREMELKRKFREVDSISARKLKLIKWLRKRGISHKPEPKSSLILKRNNWWRRHIFSLTAWYYHLSRYGEDLLRPTLAGIVILFLSTLLFATQSDPTLHPSFLFFTNTSPMENHSSYIGMAKMGDIFLWQKAFERSMADFLPLLPMGSTIKIGLIDYIVKIVGGVITFALIAIALRRRFERKYTH